MKILLLVVGCICSLVSLTHACKTIEVSSDLLGRMVFEQIPLDDPLEASNADSGRPAFVSRAHTHNESNLYLFHKPIATGEGLWMLSDRLGSTDGPLAALSSWAVLPQLATAVRDPLSRNRWRVRVSLDSTESSSSSGSGEEYAQDDSFSVRCASGEIDRTLFFDSSSRVVNHVTGYFVERTVSPAHAYQGPVFSLVRFKSVAAHFLFVVRVDDDEPRRPHARVWLIGERLGVDSGVAMTRGLSVFPDEEQSLWLYGVDDPQRPWVPDEDAKMWSSFLFDSLYTHDSRVVTPLPEVVRRIHDLRRPDSSGDAGSERRYYRLRNGVSMPAIGLGTGGIANEMARSVFEEALQQGYQLFDMAREYGNEHLLGHLLDSQRNSGDERLHRKNVFVETKIWPTDFDIYSSVTAVLLSLGNLFTNYIDLYLLHWPECDPSIEWMHCHTTKDHKATWRTSWRVLEKAYSEGFIMSIGVSNFDVQQLEKLKSMSDVLPHVVQNWAQLGHLDEEVRRWCATHDVVYQPYATGRNLHSLSPALRETTQRIAKAHNVSEHALSLRFFLQSGAAVIPRSTKSAHLRENLAVGSWSLSAEEMRELGADALLSPDVEATLPAQSSKDEL